jgi:predicted DNA-binding transcriptional regulator AlpA
LGYRKPDHVTELYARHADEFTSDMTALVEMPTSGGVQRVRIFSPRGCHLLAMFARTPKAKAFRRWVLDVLDQLGKDSVTAATARPKQRSLVSGSEQVGGVRLLRFATVRARVGYSRMHIDRLEKAGRFPQRVQIGPNAVGWIESEVTDWIAAKAAQRAQPQVPQAVANVTRPALPPPPQRDNPPTAEARSTIASPLAEDMLEGADQIADFMGMDRRQIYHVQAQLPIFTIGAKLFARKSTLLKWVADLESAAIAKASG